jgi:hypothetical protein
MKVSDAMLTAASNKDGWKDISTAPKDGRWVLLWMVHKNAQYSDNPIEEGWEAPVVAQWIDHNGGGWTWHGLCGSPTRWSTLPPSPKAEG